MGVERIQAAADAHLALDADSREGYAAGIEEALRDELRRYGNIIIRGDEAEIAINAIRLAALPLPADLEEWEKLAEGVTPGPWDLRTLENFGWNIVHYRNGDKFDLVRIAKAGEEATARWLNACSPDRILSLVRALSAERARADAAEAARTQGGPNA